MAPPANGSRSAKERQGAEAPEVPAKLGSKLNNSGSDASNREQRAREAEEDRALIVRAQSGDQAAFRSIVERHQRRAFAIAIGMVRDENDANEVVQEAFLRVHRSLANFEGTSSFFTWLYRIVTNLSIDLMRKPGRRMVELDESRLSEEVEGELVMVSRLEGHDPLEVVRRKELAARIQEALEALPWYHRSVIVMREIEGLSYEEMAEAMGVSKGTIMSRLFHARQKMQKALADVHAELDEGRAGRSRAESGESQSAPPVEEEA